MSQAGFNGKAAGFQALGQVEKAEKLLKAGGRALGGLRGLSGCRFTSFLLSLSGAEDAELAQLHTQTDVSIRD